MLRVCIALLAVALVPVASSFASAPPPSPHEDITREGAGAAGWPEGAMDALVLAVHEPDVEEVVWDPEPDAPLRLGLRDAYRSSHHCDRIPPADNASAFDEAGAYIRAMREEAVSGGDPERVVDRLGKALHALQDCFSHSDYVDLDAAAQARFLSAVLNGSEAPAVRLTAVQPGIEHPGAPDDAYAHDRFAKDSADQNDEASAELGGTSKHALAKEAATHATQVLVADVLSRLPREMRSSLETVEEDVPDRLPIPVAPLAMLAVALALLGRSRR